MLTPTTGGIKFLAHVQSTPNTVWTINHNFGFKPLVEIQVYDDAVLKKAYPLNLEHVDDNTVVITWTVARTGFATIAGEQVPA